MGVYTVETETHSVIPAARLFKSFVLDSDHLLPKVAPKAVGCVEILEGSGGPGTIKKITFGEGSQFSYVKHKVESIDHDNLSYCYSIIEGDALSDKLEKISYETKIVPTDGGSVIKSTSKYHTKGDVEIKEEEIKTGKEKAAGLFKAIEAYLLGNPKEYN